MNRLIVKFGSSSILSRFVCVVPFLLVLECGLRGIGWLEGFWYQWIEIRQENKIGWMIDPQITDTVFRCLIIRLLDGEEVVLVE